ncbi:MAG TPA: hypothetical protein VFJ82_22220 [Longimicrobium sp.]|nr:hypothetical protein [Longimicrobium sp.]
MRKLSLNVDELTVESFRTDEAFARPGTVRGLDSATVDQDTCNTCNGCSNVDTCVSCAGTCGNTCASCGVTCSPCQTHDGRPTCDQLCSVGCPSADGRC